MFCRETGGGTATHLIKRGVIVAVATAVALGGGSGATAIAAEKRPMGDVRPFATIPYPGQPGGLAVKGNTLFVNTFGFVFSGSGDSVPPATWHRPVDAQDWVFAYDTRAKTQVTDPFPVRRTRRAAYMGLSGMTVRADGKLYVVDMNGRVLRIDPQTREQELYATFPADDAAPVATMPLDITFDRDGYAYVTDIAGNPVIWRVPPGGGEAERWFTDPRIGGVNTMGSSGIRVDPEGRNLYFSVAGGSTYPTTAGHGLVYALPLDHPQSSDLKLLHTYESAAEAPPVGTGPVGVEFGASGRLYVVLPGTGQVSVLRPTKRDKPGQAPDYVEETRHMIPGTAPNFIVFDGRGSALVSTLGDESPESWIVWDLWLDDVHASQRRAVAKKPKAKKRKRHARRR